jgi:hypothetical protein
VANSAAGVRASIEEDDEVPELVENFDEASKEEVPVNVAEKDDKGKGKENNLVSAAAGEETKGERLKEVLTLQDSKDKQSN